MSTLWQVGAISVLGAAGALIRWGLIVVTTSAGSHSRVATVVANILGSFGAGVVLVADWGIWSWLLAAGLFGSVTTLSTLAADVAERFRDSPARATSLAGVHVLGGFAAVLAGVAVGSVVG